MATITFTGTGGIIEGNLGTANVNVNLDDVLNFDGVDDKIDTNITLSTTFDGACTISAWLKPTDGQGTAQRFFGTRNSASEDWVQGQIESSGKVSLYYESNNNSTEAMTNTAVFSDGVTSWTHVAFTIPTSGTIGIYVNGVAQTLDGTKDGDMTGITVGDFSSTVDLFIGCRSTNGTPEGFFNGYIADVRFQDSVLTAAEIGVLASKINVDYNLVNSTQPTGWYKLTNNNTSNSGSGGGTPTVTGTTRVYDAFSVDVYDNSTTTDGTFTVTQGKVECKALSYLTFVAGNSDYAVTSDDTVIIDDVDSTIAFWYKGASPGTGTIAESRATSNDAVIYSRLGTELRYYTSGSGEFGLDASEVTACGLYDDEWHHVAFVLDHGGALADQRVYVDGVSRTLTAISTVSSLDVTWRGFKVGGQLAHITAELRDIKVFDYPLSADQASSLCSNTYPQTPKHYWKFDEGTGNAVDSGTGTSQDMTINGPDRVDGTLDLDGTLTIATTGTLSAPRDNLTIAGGGDAFDNNGTDPTTSFIHNDGTVTIDGGNMALRGGASSTGTHFYNLTQDGSGYIDGYERYTVENKLTTKAGVQYYMNGDNYIYIGKSGVRAGEFEINGAMNFTTNGRCYIEGAGGPTLPALIDYNGSHSGASGDTGGATAYVHLTNTNWDGTLTMGSTNFKLLGDAEFDAVIVSSGAELDLNGQRATFGGGLFNNTGTLTDGGNNSLIHITGTSALRSYTGDSSTQWSFGHHNDDPNMTLGNTDMIISGGAASIKMPSTANDFARTVLVSGSGTQTINSGVGFCPQNLIVGSEITTHGSHNNKIDTTNLTIPTGGTLTANASTLTVAGDFTTSGGLIGKSALDFDGTNDYVDLSNDSAWQFGTSNFTLEAWFRSDGGSGNRTIIANGDASDNGFLLYMQSGNNIKWYVNAIAVANAADVSYEDSKWHHVAAVRDGNDYLLYIDGKLKDKSTQSAQNLTHSGKASIGARDLSATPDAYWEGQIAMVRAFNDARTQTELRADMFNAHASMANTGNLVAMYQFDEGTGGTVENIQTNDALDGAISGATWAGAGDFDATSAFVNLSGTGTVRHADGTINLSASTGNLAGLYVSNSAVFNLNGYNLNFGSGATWEMGSSTTLSGTGSVAGNSSTIATTTIPSGIDAEVVGNASYLAMQSGSDLTVVGNVTGCTFADSTANIRQWHHTLDTQQLLDADEGGDDDLRLTKPALDNALELMTK